MVFIVQINSDEYQREPRAREQPSHKLIRFCFYWDYGCISFFCMAFFLVYGLLWLVTAALTRQKGIPLGRRRVASGFSVFLFSARS